MQFNDRVQVSDRLAKLSTSCMTGRIMHEELIGELQSIIAPLQRQLFLESIGNDDHIESLGRTLGFMARHKIPVKF